MKVKTPIFGIHKAFVQKGQEALRLAGNFSAAATRFAKAGMPEVSDAKEAERRAICQGCDFWDKDGWMGLGKCTHTKCGCSPRKLRWATEACPEGKWPAEVV